MNRKKLKQKKCLIVVCEPWGIEIGSKNLNCKNPETMMSVACMGWIKYMMGQEKITVSLLF